MYLTGMQGDVMKESMSCAKTLALNLLTKQEKDDVLLFRFESGTPSHSAIYMGNGMMLHHMLGRCSCIEPYDGTYKMNLVGVLRYGQ
mgnify:CR=1 FL=1